MLSVESSILFAIAFDYQGGYSCSSITDNIQDASKIIQSNKNLSASRLFLTDINVLSLFYLNIMWYQALGYSLLL